MFTEGYVCVCGGEGGGLLFLFLSSVCFCLHKVELLSFKTDETLFAMGKCTVEPH